MSLRYAILTALTEKASTGIELARRFDRSIAYFWPATHQQIYRELDKLVADQLIAEVVGEAPPTRGNPRRFAVEPQGREALHAWAIEALPSAKRRDPLMVQIRAAAALGDIDVRPLLIEHRRRNVERLAEYTEIERVQFSGELDERARLQLTVLRAGIATARMWIEWTTQSLDDLDR